MIEECYRLDRRSVVCASLDRECALSGSGTYLCRFEMVPDHLSQSQSGHASSRQNDRIKLAAVELSQSSIDVTTKRNDLEVGTE